MTVPVTRRVAAQCHSVCPARRAGECRAAAAGSCKLRVRVNLKPETVTPGRRRVQARARSLESDSDVLSISHRTSGLGPS
eukprot:1880122-Rhodomonas_salina.2